MNKNIENNYKDPQIGISGVKALYDKLIQKLDL